MAARRQLVVFNVGGESFAVDIMLTKEVVPMREITPVPETAGYVEGVMNLRGHLLPVLDFRKRLRAFQTTSHKERRIIVVNLDGKRIGLMVDGASEVIKVSEDMIEPAPDLISEIGGDYVEGIINLTDRFITLIDLRTALSGEITGDLDEVMKLLSSRQVTPVQAA